MGRDAFLAEDMAASEGHHDTFVWGVHVLETDRAGEQVLVSPRHRLVGLSPDVFYQLIRDPESRGENQVYFGYILFRVCLQLKKRETEKFVLARPRLTNHTTKSHRHLKRHWPRDFLSPSSEVHRQSYTSG
jgi:hypothetical protein